MLSRVLVIALSTFASVCGAHAQLLFDAFDPQAVALADAVVRDSVGPGMELIEIESIVTSSLPLRIDDGMAFAWSYTFYSWQSRRFAIVRVRLGFENEFEPYLWYARPLSPVDSLPRPLELDEADASSRTFLQMLRAHPEFASFRTRYPELRTWSIRLRTVTQTETYAPPLTVTGAAWSVVSAAIDDSVLVWHYAVKSRTLEARAHRALDVDPVAQYSRESDVRFAMTNDGRFAYNLSSDDGYFETPTGSNAQYLGGAGLWIGARKIVDGVLRAQVFITYDPTTGESWASPGEALIERADHARPVMQSSSEYDRTTGAGIGGERLAWPLWLVDSDTGASFMKPGVFVPRQSDRVASGAHSRPAFVGSATEQFVARYHDGLLSRYTDRDLAYGGFPLGLQIQENVFTQPGGVPQSVIVQYTVINVGPDTLRDVVLAAVADFDIGNPADDAAAFYSKQPNLRAAYAWSAAPGPLGNVAMILIEAPQADGYGRVDNSDRAWFRATGRVGTFNSWTATDNPTRSRERYAVLSNANLDPAGSFGDQFGALASTPVSMHPGDTAYLTVGYGVYHGDTDVLARTATNLINTYFERRILRAPETSAPQSTVVITPNPAREYITLRRADVDDTPSMLTIIDALGRVRMRQALAVGEVDVAIDTRMLEPGSYSCIVSGGGLVSTARATIVR